MTEDSIVACAACPKEWRCIFSCVAYDEAAAINEEEIRRMMEEGIN